MHRQVNLNITFFFIDFVLLNLRLHAPDNFNL